MLKEINKTVLVGFGNEYRKDDGLGIKLLDLIDEKISKIKIQELSIDILDDIKDFETVIFVDAALEGEDINFRKIEKEPKFSPLTHHLSPEELLIWAENINKKNYEFYLLSIRGYDFDFGEELSEEGGKNLLKAKDFLLKFLKEH
ncbi:MAG TPA: hydrogenase maturation protease [Caldisericia bacterium]|nr:hydrogenase maturation protease [Caldisericia bacterium]HQL66682.1 hydrogenase maturation protease [Caldisericia bacterium]HQN48112.1 hydrogenase maturation protease [Caldisericia bacterium]HQO99464.1 hydrogenase maturation protease [Caldisericia bacterium]